MNTSQLIGGVFIVALMVFSLPFLTEEIGDLAVENPSNTLLTFLNEVFSWLWIGCIILASLVIVVKSNDDW